jgi:hypothetical protein
MRADAHYVDQLTSRRTERPQAEPRREPVDRDVVSEPRYRRGDRVLAELSADIATIYSAAELLAAETSPVARRVSLDLIRSHAWRASWLFRAHQILDGAHRPHMRPRPIGPILAQVRDGLAPECRLTGSTLTVHVADWNAVVDADEAGLVAGITGAVLATLGLAADGDGLTIRVTATVADGELRTIEITQEGVRVGTASADRPNNWTASLGATVAKSVAHLFGGETAFLASDKRGSTVRLTFRR